MVDYDPFGPAAMTDPLPIYRELRAQFRAYPLPQYDAFALPRFADVWDASRDRTHFSIVEGPVSHRERLLVHNDGAPDRTPPEPMASFSTVDPPRHTTLRGAIAPAFTPGAVRRGEDAMRAQARALLEELVSHGRFDVVRDLAAPVATVATCAQLGVPELDAPRVTELVNTVARRDGLNPGIGPEGQQAMGELARMTAGAVHAQLAHGEPTPVVAALHTLEVDGRRLTEMEIATQLTTMVIGGVESLPKVIGGGVRSLAAHPDQRAALAGDLGRVPAAFEEILRLHLPLQFGTRTLLEDAEIAGTPMRAGQRVMLLYVSANHDDAEFPDADRFDIDRTMDRHLGFGHGVHFCIGAHSARLEAIVILQELLALVPEYAVDESGVERLPSEFQIGDTAVPIECSPR
jgi:cytochrome P450